MNRRNFLKTASSFALLTAGTTTGVSRVFAAPLHPFEWEICQMKIR